MDKTVILHYSKFGILSNINANDSFAGHTHMLNLNSELPNSDYISFIYASDYKILIGVDNMAPWFFTKWISLIARIPFVIYVFLKYDRIIIYHSEGFYYYFPIFLFFKKKIILQVNEIYANVVPNKIKLYFELKYINTFQKIIVSNIWLKENWFPKKNVIVRGGYFRFQKVNNIVVRPNNTFIYVGSVDEVKMGNLSIVKNLIETTPNNIELYLCVLASDEIYQLLTNLIVDKPQVKLFRNVKDKELTDFYHKCKYGLVLQDSTKPFNLSSFPSKVFSYLNNGVTPIAQKNYSILHSEVCNLFCFTDNWNWDSILDNNSTITNVDHISKKLKEELNNFIYTHKI
jgi:hypothetical protein